MVENITLNSIFRNHASKIVVIVVGLAILLLAINFQEIISGYRTIIELIVLEVIMVELYSNYELHKTGHKIITKVSDLERKDLVNMLTSTALGAEKSIIHLTYTFHTPEEEGEMGALLNAITSIKDKIGSEKIRFLGPPHNTKIDRLYLRKKAGASVRINDNIALYDTRFQVVDGKNIVITVGEPSDLSRRGYLIESEHLGNILQMQFDFLWKNGTEYDDYVKELMKESIASCDFTPSLEHLSKSLGLDMKETERIFKEIKKNQSCLSDFIVDA